MKKVISVLTCTFVICFMLSSCGGANGAYTYNDFSVEIKSNGVFALYWGDNLMTGSYEKNEDGEYHFTQKSPFTEIDMTGVMDGKKLLLSGNIILRNANKSVSDKSMLNMDNVPFEK